MEPFHVLMRRLRSPLASPIPNEAHVNVQHSEGGGSHPEGVTYRYRFAFADAVGTESTVSDELQVQVPAGNGAADNVIGLQNVPTNENYDSLRVYRTAANGNDYYLLDTVDISGGPPVNYSDNGSKALDLTKPLDQTVLTGNYSYLVTFVKAGQEETRPSTLIGPVNVANGRIHLDDLPIPVAPGPDDVYPLYDRVRIYRNLATDQSTFFLVDEIAPGQTYTDSLPDAELMLNQQIDLDGPKVDPNTRLVNVIKRDEFSFEHLFELGTLDFAGRKGGRLLRDKQFEVTETSTLQDLMDFMRASTGIQRAANDPGHPIPNSVNNIPGDSSALAPGLTLTAEGRIRLVSNNGVDNAITVGLSAFSMTTTSGAVTSPNLGFATIQEAKGQSAVADFLAYDSLGVPLNVRITAVMQSRDGQATTYRWFADSPDNDPLSGRFHRRRHGVGHL